MKSIAERLLLGLNRAGSEKRTPDTLDQTRNESKMEFSKARYDNMPFNRVGSSGLKLPAISLGLWHNFGAETPTANQFAMLKTAFDLGVTHFDVANNYGGGMAETNLGYFLKREFSGYRDELIISSKAGFGMWEGPYGHGGSRKYLISSLDQSLKRLQLDYVDIFYHHCMDAETPVEESASALIDIVKQGKALYVGISNYYGEPSRRMTAILKEAGVHCLINQLPFNILDRNASESGELDALANDGVGAIAFCPLAQGLLTGRYLDGVPEDSRAATSGTALDRGRITEDLLGKVRALNQVAAERGQTLAQMALCWVLVHRPMASALIGASRPEQIVENVKALDNLDFSDKELARIREVVQ